MHITGWSHGRIAQLCARKLALQFLDALPMQPDPELRSAILQLVQHSPSEVAQLILKLGGDHSVGTHLIATGEFKQHEQHCQLALFAGEIWQTECYFLFVKRGDGEWSAGENSIMPVVRVAENMPRDIGITEVVWMALTGISDFRLH